MSRLHTNAAAVERAIAMPRALAIQENRENSLSAHLIIDDMVGLAAYRAFMNCPDTETLAAYAEEARSLPLERAVVIATHEKRCPLCASDIADMRLTLRQQVAQALNSLPEWTTELVGQEALRDQLSERLVSGDSQVVTLTAPSGMGKTRLMLETALEQSYLFRDGIWLLPNSGADDMDGIAASLSDMMQLGISAKPSAFDQLCEHLANKRALIAIDSIDSIDSRKASVSTALSRLNACAPEVVCLTTGQARIGIASERPFTVSPLDYLPTLAGGTIDSRVPTETLLALESMQMFSACAEQVVPDWNPLLSDESAVRATGTICAYTAGNPLAIELAAARLHTMSPVDIQQSLASSTPSLLRTTDSPGLSLPASLRSLLTWSIGMLSTREAHLLQSLANFRERFTPEQARAVAAEEEAETLLEMLRAHSLLQRWRTGGRTFYRLPDPVAQFVNSQLHPATRATVSRRFVAYFGLLAQDLASQMEDRRQLEAMRALEANLPHLRVAMETATTTGQLRTLGQIGLSLYRFLSLRGYWKECQERLRMARDAFAKTEADGLTHQAELTLARSLINQGEYSEVPQLLQKAWDGFERGNNIVGMANVQRSQGTLAQVNQEFTKARYHFESALKLFRSIDDPVGLADCRISLGMFAAREGDYPNAEKYMRASLAVYRDLGDRYLLGLTLANLENLVMEQNHYSEARALFEESLQVREELGDVRGIASATASLGWIWLALQDFPRAEYCFARAQRSLERIKDRRTLAQVRMGISQLELAQGRLALETNNIAEAHRHLYLALSHFQTMDNTDRQIETLLLLADLMFQTNKPFTTCLIIRVVQQHLTAELKPQNEATEQKIYKQTELPIELLAKIQRWQSLLPPEEIAKVTQLAIASSVQILTQQLLTESA